MIIEGTRKEILAKTVTMGVGFQHTLVEQVSRLAPGEGMVYYIRPSKHDLYGTIVLQPVVVLSLKEEIFDEDE